MPARIGPSYLYATRVLHIVIACFMGALPIAVGQNGEAIGAESMAVGASRNAFGALSVPLVTSAVDPMVAQASQASSEAFRIFAPPTQPPLPDSTQAELMIKTTLVALNQANWTGNYTVLLDLGSPQFRGANTSTDLAFIFAPARDRRLDLSAIILYQPVLVMPTVLDELGRLRFVGYFPTRPLKVVFDLAFEPIGSRWMVSDVRINAVPWPKELD